MATWLTACTFSLLIAYLLGSIPTGYTAVKMLKGIDIREIGSGSTGATNVLRTLGKGPGAFVLFVDSLKGVAAIFLIYWLFEFAGNHQIIPASVNVEEWQSWMVILAGIFAILGHSKSIFLGFTGGKSVATSLGILLAMNWQIGLATLGVFIIVVAISRIVSLSSICGAISVSISMTILHQPTPYILFAVVGGLYVIFRHRANIQRIIEGTEPKLGQGIKTDSLDESSTA
ncbi:glycerol-3-phosphate 1-O-acyltransferase PlsY [Calothrix sp. PCC 6303]|uniref:glycerol-3-phosphate 1-O-acyltransferase PlsY n=1 Tax=Calothrix sp. PCC 6303 TaxID=1170562 RepID=UPI0002A02AAE|nr:glycerol-3-phosphate 1-O-acyltransferase PlsY [Calothrix sp. PCC 6303]AFY99638.1 acyl-phosphate glycerol-3-phosphate acyltransferase [Calothrix sp. PCC 6303]